MVVFVRLRMLQDCRPQKGFRGFLHVFGIQYQVGFGDPAGLGGAVLKRVLR